ncbi:MAG: hypothetical protein ACRDE5_16655 [Ginsengibacter sp.]
MKANTNNIKNKFRSLPQEATAPYLDKIKKYSDECGCSLGAKFSVSALLLFIFYLLKFADVRSLHITGDILYGLLFIFISGGAGKLIGIGISRIKLFFLYKSILSKLNHPKNNEYVNVYKMG